MSGALTIDTTNFGALTIKRNDDANGASIQFRGKSSVYGYIGLNNSTKDKQFLRWNSDTSKTYIILDTSSTYTSNGKGVINGTTITQVDNATNSTNSTNARKLVNWYSARPTSLNTQFGDGSLRIFYATSSTTEGKPAEDSHILHLAWDNTGGWDAQLAVHTRSGKVSTRAQNSGTWQPWKTLAFTTDIPSSLKNPHALTISLNGTSQGPYDGSAAKNINITPSSIGAATSGHNHDGRYVYNYGGTQMDGASINKNALGMTTNSGITGDWWHILQAAWNGEYRWNSQIAFPTQNRNGMYYRSGLDDNTKWGSWVKLLDVNNYSSTLDSRYYTESEVNNLLDTKLNRQNLSYGTWNPRGYNLAADYNYNGGDLSISENDGKMYVSIDGQFYQNEGKYRVLDTSDIGSIHGSLTLYQYLSSTDTNWFPLVWGGSDHKNTNNSTGSLYKSYDKLSWQTSSQTLYATNIQTENIKHLSIGGGIYWNPYVESTTDGSDSASITVVKSGVAGGTTLVLSQMNDANDTIQFKTNGSAKLYHNSYPILTTQNTYVSNNKGYINGTEITQVNNANKWITARTFTIGNTSKSVDGSSNVSWSLSEIGAASSNHNHDNRYVRKWTGVYGSANKFLKLAITDEKGWIRLEVSDSNNSLSGGYGIYIIGWGYHGNNGTDTLFARCLYANDSRYTTALKVVRTSRNNYDFYFQFASDSSYPSYTINYSGSVSSIDCTVTAIDTIPTATWTSSLSALQLNASQVDWSGITNKPSVFNPAAHTHTVFKNNLMIKGTNGVSDSASIHLGIGDSDTGFKWISDGKCQIYANNTAVGEWTSGGMNWFKNPTVNGNKIWNAGNDGGDSGLDADLLDGVHLNGIFTNLANNGNDVQLTIGGVTKALTINYAKNADTIDGAHLSDIKNWSDRTASAYWKAGWYKVASAQTATNTEAFLTLDVNAAQSNGHATLFIRKRADSKPYFICTYNNNLNLADFRLYYNGMSMVLYARVPNDWNGRVFRIISEGREGRYDHIWTLYSNISSTDPNAISAEGENPYINPTYSGRVDWSNSSDKATRLQTSRTLWGRPFDGTANVSGSLSNTGTITPSAAGTYDIGSSSLDFRYGYFQWIGAKANTNLRLAANNSDNQIVLHTNENVGIGTNAPAYKLHVNGTLGVNNIATFNINNQWLTPSVLQIGRLDDSKNVSKAVIGITNGNLHIDAYHGKQLYLNYYNRGQIRLGYQTGSYYISEDGSYYNGTVASATNADTLDGYHENSFLRYRGTTSTDQEATLWNQIGIKTYLNALPDGLTGVYNYGSVISLPGNGSRFEIYASHYSSDGNGLYYRSGWNSDKKSWLKFIDSSNIGSQTVANAYHLRINSANTWSTWYWSGQSGQPSWLWGSNDGTNMYVWNPSNFRVAYATSAGNADTVDGYHASAFVKMKQFRFSQYNQGIWTKILTITINSTTDLQPVIAFSWIPSECSRTIWADFSINWRSNSPIFYAIWKGMDSRTLKVVNSSGAIWDVWVSGSKASWDPFGEIQVTYTHNITSYNGGSLGYSDTDPGGTICITGGQVNYATSASKLQTARKIWGQSFDGTADVNGMFSGSKGMKINGVWIGLNTNSESRNQTIDCDGNDNLYLNYYRAKHVITNHAGGNLGVGIDNPAYKLHVAGDVYTTTGFKKNGSSNSYVLLGGGGHKAISDFMLKTDELSNNLTTISKSLTVTQAWMDTGIKNTDLPANGTYIIQVSANNSTDYMWSNYWSGIMSWYKDGTNDSETDEIILHRAGHAYHHTIYLRTIMTTNSDGRHLRLQIAADINLSTAVTYTFKFKRVI